MRKEDLAYSLSIRVDAFDARYIVAAIAFKDDAVLGPMMVFIFFVPRSFEFLIGWCFRVENETNRSKELFVSMSLHLPSTHHVAVPTENFRQTADDDVCIGKHVDIKEVAYCFVDNHAEVVFVCQFSDTFDVRGSEKRVSRKFREESKISLAVLQSLFKIIQLFRGTEAVKDAPRAKFLNNLQGVYVWEPECVSVAPGSWTVALPVDYALLLTFCRHEDPVSIEYGAHSTGIEVYIIVRKASNISSVLDVLLQG